MSDIENTPHKRLNILTGEWVLVSPHRTKRPWQGKIEKIIPENSESHDPDCYLCPGNIRAEGIKNPEYDSTFVFQNDFSALLPDVATASKNDEDLLQSATEPGICKVVCFSPSHNLSIAEMDTESLKRVVDIWAEEYKNLSSLDYINYVTIFENKGELMGCSNRHPHGQIWAQYSIPNEPLKETLMQKKYSEGKKRCMLCDYIKKEIDLNERVVQENEHFVLLIPFWATWPYETIIIPKTHAPNILSLNEYEKVSLADILQKNAVRYDNLFETSFPYSMGFHQSPADGIVHEEWHWHIHFYPPLLRSATVKKFMVGFEMLAMAQRDLTPEQAAKILKNLSNTHYLKK